MGLFTHIIFDFDGTLADTSRIILAADFFRARLLGSAKATACLKLVSALMLAAVALILLTQVKFG